MTVGELKAQLSDWSDDDVIVVKHGDEEYDISHVGVYYDWSYKEGGDSPAIIID